jgi:hypothetical protein
LFLFALCVAAITVFLLVIGGPSQIAIVARGSVWHNSALVAGAVVLAALAAAAVVAVRRRLPAWAYTWTGAGATGLLVVFNLVVEDRSFVILPTVDIAALALFALSGLITYGTAASRGWQHSGLHSLAVCATLGQSLCFFGVAGPFRIQLGLLAVLLGALEALAVFAYVRRSDAVRIGALIGVGAANVSVAWVVEWLFRAADVTRDVSQFWALALLLTALLVGGTLLGLPGRFLRRALGRKRGQ